jgi:inner membrane protein
MPPLTNSLADRLSFWAQRSITLKIMTMGFLFLILLLPTNMIGQTIRERENFRSAAVADISSKWGNAQSVGGPVLTIPFLIHQKNDKGQPATTRGVAHFLPSELHIDGNLSTQTRYRGIYQAILYGTTLGITGRFAAPNFAEMHVAPEDVIWSEARVAFGITDMRGIRDTLQLRWNNQTLALEPGVDMSQPLRSGVSTNVPLDGDTPLSFAMTLHLAGSDSLQFYPFGKITTVHLTSAWPDPSFKGNFLPTERTVSRQGFDASWKILSLNRNYPQQWLSPCAPEIESSSFGAQLFVPVDQYTKSTRSAKYAALFILLTFGILFFIELRTKKPVHVLQYLLIGLAIVLFYSVLLSLAEYIGFGAAYGVSTFIIVSMIACYAKGVFRSTPVATLVGGAIALLYVYLFTLLQTEDQAFLIGNLGLVIALGLAMYFSRGTGWDKLDAH